MRKILIALKVVQVVDNRLRSKQGLKKIGKGHFQAYRLNPFNPLSYVFVLVAILLLLILYGVIGFFNKAENPFKWN